MKNPLFRRVAIGTFAAVAAVGLSTLFADPASAHSAKPMGKSSCADGKYTIAWTVENDYHTAVTLSNVHIQIVTKTDKGPKTDSVPHDAIPLTAQGTPNGTYAFTTEYAGTTTATLTLILDGKWSDYSHSGFTSNDVVLDGTCKADVPPPTTAPPTPTKPATHTPVPEASSPTPGLPVTGSNTTWPMVGTGGALIAGGAVLVVALRRRRRVTFTAE